MAKIAIVDDSRLARTFTVGCLKKLGHELLEIDPTSVFEVLQTLRGLHPDLILTDFLMPQCPGTSLVRSIREDDSLKAAKIVVISAHHDDEIQARLIRMGVSAFLHKPFEPKALVEQVLTLLEA